MLQTLRFSQRGLLRTRTQPSITTTRNLALLSNSTFSRSSARSLPKLTTTTTTTPMMMVARRNITYSESLGDMHDSIDDFVVKDVNGRELRMHDLTKKVTLIVNIDCKVGELTNMECKDLQDVYSRHKDRGLEIVAFPSSQFQLISEQGSNLSGIQVKEDLQKRYHVTFPVMEKVDVNGNNAHPLFMYLQKKLSGFPLNVIKWDFTVFLCVDGNPRKRYGPMTSAETIESDICEILKCHEESSRHSHTSSNTYTSHQQPSSQAQASSHMKSTGGVQAPEPDMNAKKYSREPSINVRTDDYKKGAETRPTDEMLASKVTPEEFIRANPDKIQKEKDRKQSGGL